MTDLERAEREERRINRLVKGSLRTLDHAVKHNTGIIGSYAMFSGGNDSMTSTLITAQHPSFKGVIHINTGIGVEETRQFVRDTCKREGWPLMEVHPPSRTYEDLVLEYGFPGPGGHSVMFRYLKERAVRKAVRDIKAAHPEIPRGRVILTTGARQSESQRRMVNITAKHQRTGNQVWVSVINAWTGIDTRRYIEMHGKPRNDASDKIHMSGECLCGAFATSQERADIEWWFPETFAKIHELEAKVACCGIDHGVKSTWGWGTGFKDKGEEAEDLGPLCSSCELRATIPHTHEEESTHDH